MKIPGIGERIDQRRVTLGWPTITEFALDTHRTPQVVHSWIHRGQTPKWATLERLAVELRCPLTWLIMGEEAFTAIPTLQAFHEELYGKPLDVSDKRDPVGVQGLDDAVATARFGLALIDQEITALSKQSA